MPLSNPIPAIANDASLRLVLLFSALALLPGIVISMTAFLRIAVVLTLLRQAMGLPQIPPNQVIVGLSLFLTYFVMEPAFMGVYEASIKPYAQGRVAEEEALRAGAAPLRRFMTAQTRPRDLGLMADLSGTAGFADADSVPMRVMVPAFLLSELRTAFAMGFLLFVPFLIIDLAVAALLNALGMVMLPPTAIALPFKLLVFVLADGWTILVAALVRSFGGQA